jgi:signal transduction histidine kinase
LASLGNLITGALADVRGSLPGQRQAFSVASFIKDAESAAQLAATSAGCPFNVPPVDPQLAISANRDLLAAAVANLLQNAFKFTEPHTEVSLRAYGLGEHVFIEVKDHCGGLPAGSGESIFVPFAQRAHDRSGLGLGLSIARQSVEADLGTLTVKDVPGTGCIFTICLPRQPLP